MTPKVFVRLVMALNIPKSRYSSVHELLPIHCLLYAPFQQHRCWVKTNILFTSNYSGLCLLQYVIWGGIYHQRSPPVGVGSGRSATDTPWDTAAAWKGRRFPPLCRRWSSAWTRPSEVCCSRSLPGRCRWMGLRLRHCVTCRALQERQY